MAETREHELIDHDQIEEAIADSGISAYVHRVLGELRAARSAAKDLGRVVDVVALEIRRAARLANAGDHAAAMEVITDWAEEAGWLDDLDNEDEPRANAQPA